MAQYKKGEDLEIYEMDYTTNTQLQEICNSKQPVLFNFKTVYPEVFTDLDSATFLKHSSYDVKVRDTAGMTMSNWCADSVPLKYDSFRRLAAADSNAHFITEDNLEFIEESGLYSEFEELNPYLKPSLTVQTKYDLLQGSEGAYTPLRYHTDERRFYAVGAEKIVVKMTPYRSRKYLAGTTDFAAYEFRSPIDPWNPANNGAKYTHDIEKVKYLEFEVLAGYILYIPPYWWYSIKYSSADSLVLGAIYNSLPRILANSWDLTQYYLQQDNTSVKVTKTIALDSSPIKNNDNKQDEVAGSSNPEEIIVDPLQYVE